MKSVHILRNVLAAAVLSAFFAAGAMAQDPSSCPGMQGEGRHHRGGFGHGQFRRPMGPGPGMMGALHGLDLTSDQKEQMKAVLARHKDRMQELRAARQEARKAQPPILRQAQQDPSAIREAASRMAKVELDTHLEQATLFSEIYPILTDVQRETLANQQARAGEHRMERAGKFAERRNEGDRPAFPFLGRLNLTDDQKAKVKTLMDSSRESVKALRESNRKDRENLQLAIHKPTVDRKSIEEISARISDTQLQLAIHRAETFKALHSILTDEQKKMLEERREGRRGPREGHHGRPADPPVMN